MRARPMLPSLLLGSALGTMLGSGLGCNGGDSDGPFGAVCTPNAPIQCGCPEGGVGVQPCGPDGIPSAPCDCGAATGSGDTAGTAASSTGGGGGGVCGDGIQTIGECDPEDDAYCPEDCGDTGSDSESSSGGPTGCEDAPVYASMVSNVPSVWEEGGLMGPMAGFNLCQAMGADHVCDYEEIVAAAEKGELAAVPANTTAWLHRNVPVMQDGVLYTPGVGGRCIDWTYGLNDTADGEFVTINGGVPTFTLDNDTNYDAAAPAPNPHVQAGLLECGGTIRAILCCHPECEPGA